nr:serine hydrolase domain-containing protein [Jannaschia sp. Os4]
MPAAAQEPPPFPTAGDLAAAIAAHDVPGVAMATLTGCTPGGTVTAGLADVAAGAPVTADTAFEAASLTKAVFATIVMQLVDEGVIDLDAPFAETFAYPRIPDPRYARLTPRLVLTHRTGLPNWVDEGTDFHDRTAPIPFEAEPGTAFTYSGEGFQLLQAFVEDRTGATFEALFAARLGAVMPRSAVARPVPAGVVPATAYADASGAEPRGLDNLADRAMAASSLVTTADDYARFLAFVCDGAGLEPATWAEMTRPQSPVPPEVLRIGEDGIEPPPGSWGLGWMILDVGTPMVGHGGSNDEFNAFAGFLPATGEGIVLLTNGRNGEKMVETVMAGLTPPPG